MTDKIEHQLKREKNTLMAQLVVRKCQYRIATEGLQAIVDSNDPINIAQQTLDAMKECVPN